MSNIHAVEPVPRKGSTSATARFDVVRLEAAVEAAICRAWREARAGHKEGDTYMQSTDTQIVKPAEMSPQQASGANERPSLTPNVSSTLDVCQEAVGKVLAAVEDRARADYEAALGTARLAAREMDRVQERIAVVQSRLAEVDSKAREQDEADQAVMEEISARAREALAPYVAAGVISAGEIETHVEGAARAAGERLVALRQEARLELDSLQAEMAALQAGHSELCARTSSLETRQAQLRALPCIAALERARVEEEARKAEAQREIIRFLEMAPWHELSWQKQLTPEMEKAVALAAADRTVFDVLVGRLGRELEQTDVTRPGLGWSVLRAIESLELPYLFTAFEAKKAGLVQAARRHNRGGLDRQVTAEKVVSLASRWGARVTGR